jgi:CRP/FNR family cyclic AMP-dependent transcriptional regulator
MHEADLLARVPIFSFMKKRDLQRIAQHTQRNLFHKGDLIIREGDRDGRLFIIVNGEVDVIKDLGGRNERHLRTMGPNSYFGEMALIDDLVRTASVVARDHAEVLCLQQWDLRQEIEKYPVVAIELLQMLCRRIRAIEKSMIKTLGAVLPICASCKRVREDQDSWIAIEEYISDHSETEFTHGICPKCAKELYPEFYRD